MDQLYKELSRTDTANLIATVGDKVTILVEGHIGSGKSALLHDLAERFSDTHKAVYLDMTMLDIGDLSLPAVNHDNETAVFYPNESLGLHHDGPMIIMFDEFGKASPSVKNSVLPMLIERRMGNRRFHPGTIVFATTNLGAENVGDLFKPHERNRMSFVRMAKPTNEEWIAWGVNNDLAPEILAWVKQNPQCFASFDEVHNPDDNPYIFHPKAPRTAFVTHRSMEQASHLIKRRLELGDETLTHALIGTIGSAAAQDIMSYVNMGDNLPSRKEILESPDTARVPDNPAAVIMLCLQSVGWITDDTAHYIDPWMRYMERFPSKEAGAMWASLVIRSSKMKLVSRNSRFTKWALANSYMFS